MSGSGVKLVMYLSYYDPNKELTVKPIEISKPLLPKHIKYESDLLSETSSVSRIAVPVKTTASY
jgi:hypothetical protein